MKVVVFTDYVTCSQCKKAKPVLSQFAAWCAKNGLAYIPADRSANPNLYSACKNQFKWTGGSFPQVYVVDDKLKTVLRFVARGMTLAKLTAKVKPYCAGCSDGAIATPKPDAVKPVKKPARRKRWFALVITGLSLALLSGCTSTRVTVGADGTWTVKRFSMLQKVEAKITVPNVGTIEQYSNDGGGEAFASIAAKAYELGKKAAAGTAK